MDRECLVVKALAGIGEGLLMECAGDPVRVKALFDKAIVHDDCHYNAVLKTLTEICNHAKRDSDWYAAKPDPALQ